MTRLLLNRILANNNRKAIVWAYAKRVIEYETGLTLVYIKRTNLRRCYFRNYVVHRTHLAKSKPSGGIVGTVENSSRSTIDVVALSVSTAAASVSVGSGITSRYDGIRKKCFVGLLLEQ